MSALYEILQRISRPEQLLRDEGFLVRIHALNRAISGSGVFELRVLASEAEEARRFLSESGL